MNGHLRLDPWLVLGAGLSAPLLGWWALPLGLGAAVAAHARAISHPRCAWYGPTHWQLSAAAAPCALTFDDGPHAEVTPRLLDLLAERGQRATFFLIGSQAQQQGPLLRRMLAEGHSLGLHSWHHDRAFALRSGRRQEADLRACAAAIADASGAPPPRLVRPPVGLRGPATAGVLRRNQWLLVTWTASGRDGCGADPQRVLRRLRGHLRPGAILVLHDGHEPAHPRDPSAVLDSCRLLLDAFPAQLHSRALVVRDDHHLGWAP